jgi:hypothetical protein
MQRDGAQTMLIEVLVYFEQTGFSIDIGAQGLPERREVITGNHDNRPVNLGDYSDR